MGKELIDFIPPAFREPLYWFESALPAVLGPQLSDVDANIAMHYVQGAMIHHERLRELPDSKAETRVFKATIKSVEVIERKNRDSGFVLGRKATVHYMADNGQEIETMDTQWIEYNGYDRAEMTWDVALGRTIHKIAEESIGRECLIRKVVHEVPDKLQSGGNKVRYIANLIPLGSNKNEKSGGAQRSDRNRAEQEEWENVTGKEIEEVLDRFDDEVTSLRDEDEDSTITELRKALNGSRGDVDELLDDLADYLGIPENDETGFRKLEKELHRQLNKHNRDLVVATVLATASFSKG